MSFSGNDNSSPDSSGRQFPASRKFCPMCGRDNPLTFGLEFHDEGPHEIGAFFTGDDSMQGYAGIMHGGILSALLDTAMAQCLLRRNIEAVTGSLQVRFFESVACNSTLRLRAWIDESLPPLYHLKAEIRVDGRRMAKAKAKFMARS